MFKWLLPFIFLVSGFLDAQAPFDHPLTISECVDFGLKNQPETKQAWWVANRAASSLGSAKSDYYPQIDLNLNASNGKAFVFGSGANPFFSTLGADLTLSWLLFDFGGRESAVESAKSALIAANWQTNWSFQKVMLTVLENVYSTLHAYEVLQAALISSDDARLLLDTAIQLNRAGLVSITDVYTGEATLSHMQMDVAMQQAIIDIQKGKLAVSMGLPADAKFELSSLGIPPSHKIPELSKLIEIAEEMRADLMAKRTRVSETIARQGQIKANFAPQVSLIGAGGMNTNLGKKNSGGHYLISLNVDFPLFTGFDALYQNQMSLADTNISLAELAELQLNISLEVLTQSRTLLATQEMIVFAENSLKNSSFAYEGVLEKYRAGKERIAEVSNAQRQLAQARVRYSDVKTRMLTSMANLAFSIGTLLPHMRDSCTK